MSESKTKYVTFRDLREVRQALAPAAAPALEKPLPAAPVVAPRQTAGETSGPASTSTSSTSTPSTTSTTRKKRAVLSVDSQQTQLKEVTDRTPEAADSGSPRRDFQKVPNSIIREALPERLFRGKSKQVWDYLWSISRGAITPSRTLKKSRNEIKSGSGLGSMVTVDAALLHLESAGLIAKRQAIGSPGGNEYEIYSLEEAEANAAALAPAPAAPIWDTRPLPGALEATGNAHALAAGGITPPRDAQQVVLQDFAALLLAAGEAILGAELPVNGQERRHWRALGELLAQELTEAAQKVDGVSSVPAFLTAHLKRKLNQKEPKKMPPALNPETDPPAGVRSQFTLAECRLYADNLQQTKQGIKNPGGFAMAIHRSGLADTMIATFLRAQQNPAPALPSADAPPEPIPPARLSAAEIAEQVSILSDLLQHGFTLADAERQYGRFIHPADWAELQQKLKPRSQPAAGSRQ